VPNRCAVSVRTDKKMHRARLRTRPRGARLFASPGEVPTLLYILADWPEMRTRPDRYIRVLPGLVMAHAMRQHGSHDPLADRRSARDLARRHLAACPSRPSRPLALSALLPA